MSVTMTLLLGVLAAPPLDDAQRAPPLAAHHGRVDGDTIAWTTVITGDLTRGQRLPLTAPLPASTVLEEPSAIALLRGADGRFDAVAVLVDAVIVRGHLRVPRAADGLGAPLLAGAIAQRVSVESQGARFTPDAALSLSAHVGYRATGAVDRRTRERIDDRCGAYLPEPGPAAMYLDGARPLVGTWVDPGVPMGLALAIGAIFTALVAALVAAQRGLAKRARAERADALLGQELESL